MRVGAFAQGNRQAGRSKPHPFDKINRPAKPAAAAGLRR